MAKRFICAVDLGGTNLRIALLDLNYRIIDRLTLDTRSFKTKKILINALVEGIDNLVRNNKIKKTQIIGVGMGLPGPIDTKQGIVHFFPNIPGWKRVRLKRILEDRLGLDVFIDNDANLMCLAEYLKGAAKGARNVICLTLGTGVGAGIIIEGKLYRGSSYVAGEIGHIPINEVGPRCNCGGIACLEAYIGNRRIIQKARRIFGKELSPEELSRLARSGNKKAKRIWLDVGLKLGLALSGVVNLINPDCIVIGGGISGAGRILFDKVRQTVLKRAMPTQAHHVRILKAKLGNDAGLIGAAILAKEANYR